MITKSTLDEKRKTIFGTRNVALLSEDVQDDILNAESENGIPRFKWDYCTEKLATRRGQTSIEMKPFAQNRSEFRKWQNDAVV